VLRFAVHRCRADCVAQCESTVEPKGTGRIRQVELRFITIYDYELVAITMGKLKEDFLENAHGEDAADQGTMHVNEAFRAAMEVRKRKAELSKRTFMK
jgi:hypothetical protein